MTSRGEQYIPLDALDGLSYNVDEERQVLTITAPARLFENVTLSGTAARRLSFGGNVEYASRDFTRLGLLPGEPIPRLTTQLSATAGLGPYGSLSVSRTREDYYNSQSLEIASIRDSLNVGKIGYLTLSLTRTLDNTRDTTVALGFTHAFNARTIVSATATSDSTGTGTELDVQQSLPAGRGFGYRVVADAGENRAVDATLDLQGDAGTYELEAQEQAGTTLSQVSASGGLALLAVMCFPAAVSMTASPWWRSVTRAACASTMRTNSSAELIRRDTCWCPDYGLMRTTF
jgi:outer membrane usher protein FimD/PapC